ncbi:hypothetical protein F7725_028107 [Dissostichus mawsoni]|uniref:Uncharacterized protein n=1 Tax=Dissostichus mawsoni TaxID=36200 RepID=A0A7J5XFS6_DISMA|nr:hypothetical protein F7725_028107 [Dissostichus mawsoni]
MPTSKLRLPAARDGAPGWGTVPLNQALSQLLDLQSQLLNQREGGGLHHLPLEPPAEGLLPAGLTPAQLLALPLSLPLPPESQTQLLLHRLQLHSRVRVRPPPDPRAQLPAELRQPPRLLAQHLPQPAPRDLDRDLTPLQLTDEGVSLSQDAALSPCALLMLPLHVPPGVTHLLQLQSFPPQQQLQALTHTEASMSDWLQRERKKKKSHAALPSRSLSFSLSISRSRRVSSSFSSTLRNFSSTARWGLRPLQVGLQPLQGSAQVVLRPHRLPLHPLIRLQLQLGLEERRLQSQNLTLTPDTVCTQRLEENTQRGGRERRTQTEG